MEPTSAALALGASLRLTRLVVVDEIGQWFIKDPIDEAAQRYWERHKEHLDGDPWWWKYRSGLDCPFCVGFWIGAGVLLSQVMTRGTRAEGVWKFVAGALTLNEVAGHLGARLGDVQDDE